MLSLLQSMVRISVCLRASYVNLQGLYIKINIDNSGIIDKQTRMDEVLDAGVLYRKDLVRVHPLPLTLH